MGKLPFLRGRRKPVGGWRGSQGTGGLTGSRRLPQPPRFGEPRRRPSRLQSLRPWLLAAAFIALAFIARDAPSVSIPFLPGAERQEVPALAWRACDEAGGAAHCVVDGDTVRIDGETIRVTGVDTPELAGPCEGERIAARAARAALAGWLNGAAFTISGDARDKYGRPLRAFTRGRSDAAETLIAQGVARPYTGDVRTGWCS